jgi:hypothetical protein
MDGFKRLIVCINFGSQRKRKVYADSLQLLMKTKTHILVALMLGAVIMD